MEEMQQSLRICEQAMKDMPEGPIMVDTAGKIIPAAYMVDEAKMGRTKGFKSADVVADPTLDGTTKPFRSVYSDNKRVALPAKEDTYGNIEGLMNHFKLVMHGHGIRPPKGESYFAVEGANGELGFFVVSDGTDRPYRVRVRPPCFPIMAGLPNIIIGEQIGDLIPTFGSVNMIGGELDH
jgi:NADH-quinone oxidoreductase subunit D